MRSFYRRMACTGFNFNNMLILFKRQKRPMKSEFDLGGSNMLLDHPFLPKHLLAFVLKLTAIIIYELRELMKI